MKWRITQPSSGCLTAQAYAQCDQWGSSDLFTNPYLWKLGSSEFTSAHRLLRAIPLHHRAPASEPPALLAPNPQLCRASPIFRPLTPNDTSIFRLDDPNFDHQQITARHPKRYRKDGILRSQIRRFR